MASDRARAERLAGLWPWLLALLVTVPLLAPGFVLTYDMVFVPRQDLLAESLGLGGPLPRAVPVDAVVALVTQLIPGAVVQKAVLLGLLGVAGWGAARLVPTTSLAGRMAAGSWYVWNPFVAERLVIGHWSLLVGYAALPWLVRAALQLRAGAGRSAQLHLVALLVPAALTPSAGVIALLTVVPVLAYRAGSRELKSLTVTLACWTLLNAPWWLPGILHPSTGTSGAEGVAAFSARAEGPLGVVGSLLTLGGIWNADVVPASRELWVVVLWAATVLLVSAAGLRTWVRRAGPGGTGLVVAAGLGLVLALLGAVPVGADLAGWLAANIPGAGLLRDGHKFVAPLAVLQSSAFGLGCVALTARLRRPSRPLLRVALVLVPLAAMPDLAWGAAGRLEPVAYPSDWAAVRQVLQDDPDSGDVVSLPWQAFRSFPWNDDRVQLDPAPRWLPTTVLVDDTLLVGGVTVSGEDPRAAEVDEALTSGRPVVETLPRIGVGWVLVTRGTPGVVDSRLLAGSDPVYVGDDLTLLRVGPAAPRDLPTWAPLVVAVDLAAVLLALVAVVAAGVAKLPRTGPPRWYSGARPRREGPP